MSSSRCEPLWMPRRAVLMRDRLLASFEPHRSENPAGGRFARKPTVCVGGRAFSRPPTRPSDATSELDAPASHSPSGQSVRVPNAPSILAEQLAYYRAIANEYEDHSIDVAGQDELLAAIDGFRP